ncbi:hypothetical protein Scep_018824 [Stephania cephalantha]|uniref:Uncharacterized protein n=1 Tax=Stephania cephalantha TaxID=152367 RepID=A0AAP0I9T1_9MAGN
MQVANKIRVDIVVAPTPTSSSSRHRARRLAAAAATVASRRGRSRRAVPSRLPHLHSRSAAQLSSARQPRATATRALLSASRGCRRRAGRRSRIRPRRADHLVFIAACVDLRSLHVGIARFRLSQPLRDVLSRAAQPAAVCMSRCRARSVRHLVRADRVAAAGWLETRRR